MDDNETTSLIESIDEGITNARHWLDNRFECGTLVFHSALGDLLGQIDALERTLKVGVDERLACDIKKWRQEIEHLSKKAIRYGNTRSTASQRLSDRAEYFYRSHWIKIDEYQLTCGKYLLIGYATAIVTLVTAIVSSWDRTDLTIILVSAIQYFIIGLSISVVHLSIWNFFNLRMQYQWRNVSDNENTGINHKGNYLYVSLLSITIFISMFWLLYGIYAAASKISLLKGAIANPLIFFPFL